MNRKKVLVYVLCGPERYQWVAPDLMLRLIEAVHLRDIDVVVGTVYGVYGYDAARNRAVEWFLESDADWLCMIDNDTVPPDDFIPRVLDFTRNCAQADIVPLPYYIRPRVNVDGLLLCTGLRHPTEPNTYTLPFQIPHEWREIDVGGGGCMFIRRGVLTKMEKPWFRIPETARLEHLQTGACEDFDFCTRAQAAGFHLFTHGGLECAHLHTVDVSAVAKATVARRQEDADFLKQMGVRLLTTQKVGPIR